MTSPLDPGRDPAVLGSGDSRPHHRIRRFLFGPPRDLHDRRIFHHLSVIAFLAWVGLGADGLSSSSYGPEEAFRTLGEHTYLALPIALLMITTVFIISACYSRIIEKFPHGGGGYVVASALLGKRAGVTSGSALLVDYVLTITVSIAAAGDALFSFLPPDWIGFKLPVEILLIIALTTLNIRGVKESILALLPVFILFLITHAILIGGGIVSHTEQIDEVARSVTTGFQTGLTTLGLGGMLLLLIHAYSLGGGTYTGIEAVSNGIPIMREPRVATAKRTMIYMALSLALTAAGLVVCYLLWDVRHVANKTLNAVLADSIAHRLSLGHTFVILTLVSEGALLVVAAQAGFLDGPRVLANMAADSWMPRRFASLSDRLTTQNGIILMGVAALIALLYTRGSVHSLVIMYSINVFLTFSLSMLGMAWSLFSSRKSAPSWKRRFTLFLIGLLFCVTILGITIYEKFSDGGWITLVVTGLIIILCLRIKAHYQTLNNKLSALYNSLTNLPRTHAAPESPLDPSKPTAAILVGGYTGLGIHTTLRALANFPGQFKNVVFISVTPIDSAAIREGATVEDLENQTEASLQKYVELVESQGIAATYRTGVATDVVEKLEELCLSVASEFPHITFFAGQLVFERERWYQPILHNQTAYSLQKRLQFDNYTMVIIPARVQ